MSGRCKACNSAFTDKEGRWDESRGMHEELCISCQTAIYEAELTDDIEDIYSNIYIADIDFD